MLAGNKFRADEEVIVETEAYFEANDKLYYTNFMTSIIGLSRYLFSFGRL